MDLTRAGIWSIARWHARLLLVMCIAFGSGPSASAADDEQLGPDDTIRITVFQNPDLTTETRISSQGAIVFPLIGEVQLADRTPAEAGEVIAAALREEGYVVDPQVSVSILEVRSRRVSVLGAVAQPGRYALDGPAVRLTDILALAGGITERGDGKVVVMTDRDGATERREIDVAGMYENGDLSGDIELTNGDTLFVPSAPVFYVYGAVQQAGEYRLKPGTLVHSALSLGGGLTSRGSERGIKIHRRMPDGSVQTLEADLDDAVQPNDVIQVGRSLF